MKSKPLKRLQDYSVRLLTGLKPGENETQSFKLNEYPKDKFIDRH
jgi:hypothetical protein